MSVVDGQRAGSGGLHHPLHDRLCLRRSHIRPVRMVPRSFQEFHGKYPGY